MCRNFPHQFENKDTIFRVEVVSDLVYALFYCLYIVVVKILTKYGNLVHWHRNVLGSFKGLLTIITKKNQGTWFSDTVIVYSMRLKRPSITKPQQNMPPWCSDTGIVFLEVSNNWVLLSTEIFEINMSFEYGLHVYLFWIMSEGLSSRENIFIECVSVGNNVLLMISVFSFNLL